MRRAREEHLDQLESLLTKLRKLPGPTERSRDVFYRKSKSYLHFHQDFARHDLTSVRQQTQFLKLVRTDVSGSGS